MELPKPEVLTLFPVPSPEWQRTWNRLQKDKIVSLQTDRDSYLKEQLQYLRIHAPEVARTTGNTVLDFGPGNGSLLEIARYLGHDTFGIEVESPSSQRSPIQQAYRLLHERQKLKIAYQGLAPWLDGLQYDELRLRLGDNCRLINARQSLEFLLQSRLEGKNFEKHRDTMQMSWMLDAETERILSRFFELCFELLIPSGILLIQFCGTKNHGHAIDWFRQIAARSGLQLTSYVDRLFKWRRI